MESLEWHERLIERMIKNNPDATIGDYFKVTDGLYPKRKQQEFVTIENITAAVEKIERALSHR